MDELEEMQWSAMCDKKMPVKLKGRSIEQLLDLLCYMELKPGPPPNDRNQGLR